MSASRRGSSTVGGLQRHLGCCRAAVGRRGPIPAGQQAGRVVGWARRRGSSSRQPPSCLPQRPQHPPRRRAAVLHRRTGRPVAPRAEAPLPHSAMGTHSMRGPGQHTRARTTNDRASRTRSLEPGAGSPPQHGCQAPSCWGLVRSRGSGRPGCLREWGGRAAAGAVRASGGPWPPRGGARPPVASGSVPRRAAAAGCHPCARCRSMRCRRSWRRWWSCRRCCCRPHAACRLRCWGERMLAGAQAP